METKMNKTELFKALYAERVKGAKYIESLPTDISAAFFDNEYANCSSFSNTMLLKYAFGEHFEAVEWFFYEWKPGMVCMMVLTTGTQCEKVEFKKVINNIDDYIDWMREHEGWVD
jgi:hypothetical protein